MICFKDEMKEAVAESREWRVASWCRDRVTDDGGHICFLWAFLGRSHVDEHLQD